MADPIGGLAMLPSASNATLPTARVNLLGTPTLNYILIGNGIDWVRSPFTNGSGSTLYGGLLPLVNGDAGTSAGVSVGIITAPDGQTIGVPV